MSTASMLGTPERPLRVAIVGSGPSGFYAANALLKAEAASEVDLFDKLPTPFGLVRGGVAPDHQKIKTVTRAYDKIASEACFRFFGNVRVGVDVTPLDLTSHYDAVIWAVGAESDARLNIDGEDLAGSTSATAFVGWYNGHPDFQHQQFDLSTEAVVVVGVGNVAMDVTRVLVKSPDALASTDIADHALAVLRGSAVREVHVLGRRGAVQASFSPQEIREIGELDGVDLIVDPADLELDEASAAWLAQSGDKNVERNLDYLRERALAGPTGAPRRVVLHLNTSPIAIHGVDGRVSSVTLGRNRLEGQDGRVIARDAGGRVEQPCGLVLRAVGYRGVPIAGVPFDERRGRIANEDGRVVSAPGQAMPGQYVVGWAKRGPSGLIGTNRGDSQSVVGLLLEDLVGQMPATTGTPAALRATLAERGVRIVSYADWQRLDALECSEGAACGKVRQKLATVADMLAALDK